MRALALEQGANRSFMQIFIDPHALVLIKEVTETEPHMSLDAMVTMGPEDAINARAFCVSAGPSALRVRERLHATREGTLLPIALRMVVADPFQIHAARAWGADCFIMQCTGIDTARLQWWLEEAREIGLEPLIEVSSAEDLAAASATDVRGIVYSGSLRPAPVGGASAARKAPPVAIWVAGAESAATPALTHLYASRFRGVICGSHARAV